MNCNPILFSIPPLSSIDLPTHPIFQALLPSTQIALAITAQLPPAPTTASVQYYTHPIICSFIDSLSHPYNQALHCIERRKVTLSACLPASHTTTKSTPADTTMPSNSKARQPIPSPSHSHPPPKLAAVHTLLKPAKTNLSKWLNSMHKHKLAQTPPPSCPTSRDFAKISRKYNGS